MGGTGGGSTGGGLGLGVGCSPIGGGSVLGGLDTGCIGSPGGAGKISGMGDTESSGLSVRIASHPTVASPVVPGGQLQTGRCWWILQSASSPQIPKEHTS